MEKTKGELAGHKKNNFLNKIKLRQFNSLKE
jgi:hypothetical protein